MTPKHGLRKKFWTAFVLQLAAICFAAVVGVYGASVVIKDILIKQALQDEARHFWTLKDLNPNTQVPDTFNMKGFLLDMQHAPALPDKYRNLGVGYHSLEKQQGGELIWVERRGNEKLVLIFKQEQVDALAFWFGVMPLALLLLVVYAMVFFSYRTSKRLVSPVIWLSNQVRAWDPKKPDVSALASDKLPADMDNEAQVLAEAMHDFGQRIGQFVERERNFTSNASHELRTPLTVIRVASDMVAAEPCLSPMASRSIQRIQKAGKEMESLVEGFLLLAREDDYGHNEHPYWVSEEVSEEIEKARMLLRDKAVALDLEIESDFQIEVPHYVLATVVGNLIRNACHYTDAGRIDVNIQRGRLRVTDTGIGMSEEQLQRVFDLFYRGESSNAGGKGIGMALVKRFCDRFNWRIDLQSRAGFGTVATLYIPETSIIEPSESLDTHEH
jgi:signal transduction histidine kinase